MYVCMHSITANAIRSGLVTWCGVGGCGVVVIVMFEMFVFKHDLVGESSQPDARVGRYQVHQCKPNERFECLHFYLHTRRQHIYSVTASALSSQYNTIIANGYDDEE